jgi:cell shape-determining protein MreC
MEINSTEEAMKLLEKLKSQNKSFQNNLEENKIVLVKGQQINSKTPVVARVEIIFPKSVTMPQDFKQYCNDYLSNISDKKIINQDFKMLIIEMKSSSIMYSSVENLIKKIHKEFGFKIHLQGGFNNWSWSFLELE